MKRFRGIRMDIICPCVMALSSYLCGMYCYINQERRYVQGTVIQESVTEQRYYTISIRTDSGEYTAKIYNTEYPIGRMISAIEPGTRVEIERRIFEYRFDNKTVGYLFPEEVIIRD